MVIILRWFLLWHPETLMVKIVKKSGLVRFNYLTNISSPNRLFSTNIYLLGDVSLKSFVYFECFMLFLKNYTCLDSLVYSWFRYQLFLSNTSYLHTVLLFHIFPSNKNNFQTDLFELPWQLLPLQDRMDLGVIVMNGYSTLSRAPATPLNSV